MPAGTDATQIVDVGVVGVPVGDQERALDFYTRVLGFETRVDTPMPGGGRWIMVAPPSASTAIALVAAGGGEAAGVETRVGVETGIRFTSSDAAADRERLLARGVEVGELLRWPGVPPMFAARDADGNGFEVIEAP